MDTPQAAQRYYSLERLTELARSLPLLGDSLALLRAQVEQQLDRREKDQAHEAYRQLEAQRDGAGLTDATPAGLQAQLDALSTTVNGQTVPISTSVFRPGDIMVQMGSSCYFVYLTDHLLNEPRLWPGTFIIPGVYSVCAGTNTAGTLTRWMRDEFYKDALAAGTAMQMILEGQCGTFNPKLLDCFRQAEPVLRRFYHTAQGG